MGQDTKIQWAHHTFNPWRGCQKVAEGCKNCYADEQSKRNPGVLGTWGPNGTRVVNAEKSWKEPLKWNKIPRLRCKGCGYEMDGEQSPDGCHEGRSWIFDCPICDGTDYTLVRPRVFCASLADVFENWQGTMKRGRLGQMLVKPYLEKEWGPENWIEEWEGGFDKDPQGWLRVTMADVRRRLFDLIDATPNLDWLLVTKRPENIKDFWVPKNRCLVPDDECGIPVADTIYRKNVWLLTSVACQEDAEKNIPELLKCRGLSPVLGVSAEPLVAPIDLCKIEAPAGMQVDGRGGLCFDALKSNDERYFDSETHLDWVIVGGESGYGPKIRACDIEAIRSINRQCRNAGVPCFNKQLGAKILLPPGPRCASLIQPTWRFLGESKCGGDVYRPADPKGGDWSEWPEDMRVREYPVLSV